MIQDYQEFIIHVEPEIAEAVFAALAEEEPFESFTEETGVIHAFAQAGKMDLFVLIESLAIQFPGKKFNIDVVEHAGKNWNEEWEKNYPPVEVDDFCQVIASFMEPKPGFQFTLRIDPKMSFGTGHHETTRLIIRWCREVDFKGKEVLDMGCGTGVLGILALKMGAQKVDFVDIDEICVGNTGENLQLNQLPEMIIVEGGAEIIKKSAYDIIFANIQRNVLIRDGLAYREGLKPGGIIALSGFFDFDEALITGRYRELGFIPEFRMESGGWMLLVFKLSEA